MTIPRNHEEENTFIIRRIVTSKSDMLAGEDRQQIVLLERGAILRGRGERHLRDRCLLFIPPRRGGQLRIAAMSRIWQICFSTVFWQGSWAIESGKVRVWRLPEELVSRVESILKQMLVEYREKGPGYGRMIRLKLEELGLLLERSLGHSCPAGSDSIAPGIEEVVTHIQSHHSEDFSLASLSRLCGLTPSYFSRLFKEKTGIPVFEYINRVRIQKARGLLKRTEMSILEIAFAVGYNNISFFNRYFRKLNGMSPREYRRYIRR
jgi:AraC-like DNA-binding protein